MKEKDEGMFRLRRLIGICLCVGVLGWCVSPVDALTIDGTNGSNLSAQVIFSNVGGNLEVTLTNTSLVDVNDPPDILTAVFFTLTGFGGTLTPVSAVLNGGSTVFFDPQGQPVLDDVGGEWEYLAGLSGAPLSATSGISSSGFGLFGDPNFTGGPNLGPNLDDPVAIDGLNYGITSAGDDTTTGNNAVTGGGGNPIPLIKNSVKFTLSGLGTFTPTLENVNNISFQYGTALTEPNVPCCDDGGNPGGNPAVPEPSTMILLGSGLAAVALFSRKKWQAKK